MLPALYPGDAGAQIQYSYDRAMVCRQRVLGHQASRSMEKYLFRSLEREIGHFLPLFFFLYIVLGNIYHDWNDINK